ncbi:type II CRISPR RNA-guided endonuclease Cas9 [Varunaivibrio sulfuroxidans]|uniref:CRISPR-associated endonuclease Cas9 n=1 Tax=Varunaivibrio sulfuroxidans TaxID=1773489 RepID=A0A4V2UNL7_9PROT|nr:type II CRISPR RNA-guided endonuclease Cas9 [Varunaivibrio sulfuroxidans]TCS61621.1 CRISPR-associated Csn1 family endonuclease [Varunaivibrio sulfuroxidans]WES29504.1 type II CRISPR RNA-guided endonuclease Cas9 [Varunaivibrio sulfuroxidans]
MKNNGKGFRYRLGIDVGVASLGIAILALEDDANPSTGEPGYDILGGAVRTYPLPIGAEERRGQRGARRNTERLTRRLDRLSELLSGHGVGYPRKQATKDLLDLSPIKLRAKASREKVELPHLARALLHMARHRGSSAIREADIEQDDKEARQTAEGIKCLRREMENLDFTTYGQYLRWREKQNKPIRIDQTKMAASGDGYAFYPSREMLREEFSIIWGKQAEFHPQTLTDALRAGVEKELFFQRSITPPPPGDCPFFPNEKRLPKTSRLFQTRRIYEAVNHLRFYDKQGRLLPYTLEQRDRIVARLMAGEDLSIAEIKKEIGLSRTDKARVEESAAGPKPIKGYPFDRVLCDEVILGKRWTQLSSDKQDEILNILATEHDDSLAIEDIRHALGGDAGTAFKIVQAPLPSGYGNMGARATEMILQELKKDVVPARVAQDRAGLVHATSPDGVVYERLPYYGEILVGHTVKPMWESRYRRETDTPPNTDANEQRFGRIPNPVVHTALNQIRKVVNAVIKRYGQPETIHIELARDLNKSAEERDAITKRNEDNRKKNDAIRKELTALKVPTDRLNIQKYKLWDEQKSLCVYTGRTIELSDLYGGDADVDHILPRSKTFSDALNNKVVCCRAANADKDNRSPYEAFADNPNYNWNAILRRIPKGKEWRFKADAMDRFKDEEGFRARYGTDNSYIARVAAQYLSCLYGEPSKVVAVSSHIVGLLRAKWGLQKILGGKDDGKKARDDHRHHFIDALVAACATRSMVQRIQTEAKRCEREKLGAFVEKITPPFGDSKAFFNAARDAALNRVTVSRKADHGAGGQLHEDTLLGIVGDGPDDKGRYICRKRKKLTDYASLDALNKAKIEKTLPNLEAITVAKKDLKALKESLKNLSAQAVQELEDERQAAIEVGKKGKKITATAIYARAVRLHEAKGGKATFTLFERQKLVNIRRTPDNNRPYGGYKSGRNHRVDVYLDAKGKVKWQLISMLQANDKGFVPEATQPDHDLLWSAHKEDVLVMDNPDNLAERIRVTVAWFSEGKLVVCPITDARDAKTRKTWGEKGLSFYARHRAQRIVTDALGDITWRFPTLPNP